jgi:hypothetical protein
MGGIAECVPQDLWEDIFIRNHSSMSREYKNFIFTKIGTMVTWTFLIIGGLAFITYRIK